MRPPIVELGCRRCGRALLVCERIAAQMPLRFSLLAVLVLLAVSVVALQPSYDTNDDVFMTMIVSGVGFCPAPDAHLIFSNILIGQTLKRLYTAWPNFPWYGSYLLFVHYLAQVALLYCALTSDPERLARGARLRFAQYLTYFGVVELLFLNYFQFTTTGFLAAQAGIFLFLLAARRRAWQRDASVAWPLCWAVLFVFIAGLVRLESLSMALLVAVPLGVWWIWQAPRAALFPGGIAIAMAAALIVLATAYDRMSYEQDPRWSGFFSYNQLRVKFNDYCWTSYSPQSASVFAAIGWTKNDHQMIASWFFDDPAVYSEAHLRAIVEAYPWKAEHLTKGYFWQACRGMLRDRSVWAVMLVLPFFLASIDRGKRSRWAIVGCGLVAIGLVAFLLWNNKVPPLRAYFPILSFPLAAALLFPSNSAKVGVLRVSQEAKAGGRFFYALMSARTRQPRVRAVVVLLVIGIVMGAHRQCRRSVLVHRDRRALNTFLADLRPERHELYVCWGATLPFELVSPLDSLASWSQIKLLNLVWTQRTPWQEEIKRQFGISNLAQAMCERDDIILVATAAERELFTVFAKEHFQADVEFVQSSRAGEKLVAGHFQQRTLPGEIARQTTGAMHR